MPPLNNHFDKALVSTNLLTVYFEVEKIDLIYIKHLVKNGADVNAQDKNGDTILHVAIRKKAEKVIDFLLGLPLDLEIKNNLGLTPYMLAKNSLQLYTAIRIKKKSYSSFDSDLLIAVERSNVFLAFANINLGAKVNFHDLQGRTPLHIASIKGDIEMVDLLLSNGANSNMLDENNISVLHYALFNNNTVAEELVCKLLRNGANPNINDENDFSVIYKIIFRGYLNAFNLAIFKIKDVNYPRYIDNKTPLHIAAEVGKISVVQQLLAYGADVSIKNAKGFEASIVAKQSKNYEIAKLLNSETTKFISAAANNDKETVVKMVNNNVKINAMGCYRETALILASKKCHPQIVKFLLENNASLTGDLIEENALHYAARSRCYEAIDMLVEYGASPKSASFLGTTPEMIIPDYFMKF